jgi:hypothetical protein
MMSPSSLNEVLGLHLWCLTGWIRFFLLGLLCSMLNFLCIYR